VETTKTDILKMEREEARDKSKSNLEDVIKGEGFSEEAKKEAEQKLIAISDYIRIENDVETLVKNKGFENVTTYNENGIIVAVMKDELLNTEIAKITEIIISQTNLPADKIKITTSN
jgi:stage III sporulation protein AH